MGDCSQLKLVLSLSLSLDLRRIRLVATFLNNSISSLLLVRQMGADLFWFGIFSSRQDEKKKKRDQSCVFF